MGQRVSISTGSSDSSNSVSPFLGDYVKVKSQEDYNTPLKINPKELHFPFELKKKSSCTLQLSNNSDDYVAFKIKFMTSNRKSYSARPNYIGVVLPRSTCVITVTMKGPKEAPLDMQCKDKIVIRSIVAKHETIIKNITSEMFYKDSGYEVKECRLKVVYVAPPQ
ncbi:hypothetical protein RYX36_012269 [Vicia faba]